MFDSLGSGIIQGVGNDAGRWRMYQYGNGGHVSLVLHLEALTRIGIRLLELSRMEQLNKQPI